MTEEPDLILKLCAGDRTVVQVEIDKYSDVTRAIVYLKNAIKDLKTIEKEHQND